MSPTDSKVNVLLVFWEEFLSPFCLVDLTLVIQEVLKEVLLLLGKTQLPTPAVRLVSDIFAD